MLIRPLVTATIFLSGLSRPSTSTTFAPHLRVSSDENTFERHYHQSLSSDTDLATTQAQTQAQNPIMNVPPVQPSQPSHDSDRDDDNPTGPLTISDILPRLRSINIFASLTRDIEPISTRLSSHSQNTTLLAPLNSAIQALPRKPWEDPQDYAALGEQAYKGEDGGERASRNLRRFVEAHVVEGDGLGGKEGERRKTIGGEEVWWAKGDDGGKKKIMPGNIGVKEVVKEGANGEVWILEGVVNYS